MVHLVLQISPRIFEKIWNAPNVEHEKKNTKQNSAPLTLPKLLKAENDLKALISIDNAYLMFLQERYLQIIYWRECTKQFILPYIKNMW